MDRNEKERIEQNKVNSNGSFGFKPESGWFQRTKSGNDVYANKTYGHGKVLGGANAFAKANGKPLRSGEKFPYNPQGVSDTILYHCLRHDYVYYPHNFTDTDGIMRQRGFYDENADFHPNIKMLYYPQSDGVVCKYCGHNTIFDVNLQNVSDLWCSQCGAEINYMKMLGEEADFLVYADCFRMGKQLEVKVIPHTPYVQPKENPSYHREWKQRKPSDKSYSDYLKENFGPGESVPMEPDYDGNPNAPLKYIKTREYNPAPVKKWEPNTELIIKSNTSGQNEDSFKGFSFEETGKENYTSGNTYRGDTTEAGLTYWEGLLDTVDPIWRSGMPSMNDLEETYGPDSSKPPKKKRKPEEKLSELKFDEPLEYIKTRAYNPVPVKPWKPEQQNSSPGTAKRNEISGVSTPHVHLEDDEPLQYIKTRPYNPAPVKPWEPEQQNLSRSTARRVEEPLGELQLDETLKYIKSRDNNSDKQQSYYSEKYQTNYVPVHDYTVDNEKSIAGKAVASLDDILDVFLPSRDDVKMMAVERRASSRDASWRIDDDADYSMFKRKHYDEEEPMKDIKEYWSRRRMEE